jgi:hypothetical protein
MIALDEPSQSLPKREKFLGPTGLLQRLADEKANDAKAND